MNNPTENTLDTTSGTASSMVDRTVEKAEQALTGAKKVAADKARQVHLGIEELRESVPSALQRAAARAEDLTRSSIDRAREATGKVRERYDQAGEQAVGYIRDEPTKALLMAAATGAAIAMLLGWVGRSRR